MRRRSNAFVISVTWLTLITFLLLLVTLFAFRIRGSVEDFAVSNAKTALQNSANEAVLKVIAEHGLSYDDIAHVTRNADNAVTGIEIDAKNANILKADLLLNINRSIPKQEVYDVSIPLGTLLMNNLFGGLGPPVPFHSQISSGCNIDFDSVFENVGVNQTRHKIFLRVTLSGVILILGKRNAYTTETTFIVAETVMSGNTPQTFADISK